MYLGLAVATLFAVFPFYWAAVISLFGNPYFPSLQLVPKFSTFTLDSYRNVLIARNFPVLFRNSLTVCVATMVLGVGVSVLAAYALSRFTFLGKRTFGVGILFSQALPGIVLAIPIYFVLMRLHLLNTHAGLVLTYLTFAVPFSTWMLWGYFNTIPLEIEEAGIVDGCSRIGVLVRIVLPLSGPGVGAVALYTFMLAWEDFLYPLMILSSEKKQLLTVGASLLISSQAIYWGQLMAYVVLSVLPITLLFACLLRYFATGLTAGAMKE
ncbi:MAG: carbohydrate ABC transporter permease [candidate division NC10 bacterium]|nr:carbohydrate ABC transporter permease [candidate division NC10 bacterium]